MLYILQNREFIIRKYTLYTFIYNIFFIDMTLPLLNTQVLFKKVRDSVYHNMKLYTYYFNELQIDTNYLSIIMFSEKF